MNFLDFNDIGGDVLAKIIENAIKIKENLEKYSELMKGKALYQLYEKTSTRTAISFERAMVQLGGTQFLQKFDDTNFGVGEVQDEVRYVGRNYDVILARMKNNANLNIMAKHSTIPVINGCCDKFHPCQAMADMMTVKEKFGTYDIKMLYIGVWNNVFNSLVGSLPKLGGKLYGLTPIINEPTFDQKVVDEAMATGNFVQLNRKMLKENLKEIVKDMDVVYTDTWVDMEFINNPVFADKKQQRCEQMMPYQLNEELLKGSKAIVMHDMPMHPGYELSREIAEKHIDTILDQAENRTHVQKGILIEMCPDIKEKFNKI